ncbi:unnamed protein product [Malus baccata var. baccata]
MGFHMSQSDTSLFVKHDGTDIVVLLLYVDDIILTGSNKTQVQYKANGDIFIHQSKYARDLLHKAGMDGCKPTATPCKPHTQLLATEGTILEDPSAYRSLVGALQYLTFTGPDLSYAVGVACQYMNTPTDIHFDLVKRILRYIQGTLQCGLTYSASQDTSLTAFSDSDWAADPNTRRSVTGFVVFMGSNPISWQSKKQASVSRSSTEAEYKALAHCAADIVWIRLLERFLPAQLTLVGLPCSFIVC